VHARTLRCMRARTVHARTLRYIRVLFSLCGVCTVCRCCRSFSYIVACPAAMTNAMAGRPLERIFIGGFWGVHRSDGDLWVKLDISTPIITSLAVAPSDTSSAGKGRLAVHVGVCTYAAGCFTHKLDPGRPRLGLSPDSLTPLPVPLCQRYGLIKFFPTFARDGRLLLSCTGELRVLWLGGPLATKTVTKKSNLTGVQISNYHVDNKQSLMIHTIAFSPSFGTAQRENTTIFISGWNIGVARSRDEGHSFERIWDAYGAQGPDSTVTIALSPDFVNDGTIAASFRGVNMPNRAFGEQRQGCRFDDAFRYWNTACQFPGQHEFLSHKDSAIAVSRDAGATWTIVSEIGGWHAFPMLVRAGDTAAVQLLAIRDVNDTASERSSVQTLPLHASTASMSSPPLAGKRSFSVGRWGATASSGHVLLGLAGGGVAFGAAALRDGALPGFSVSERTPSFSMDFLPNGGTQRGVSPLVAISPTFERDGFLVAASDTSVFTSTDGGSSWGEAFATTQSTTDCAKIPHCALCRRTQEDRTLLSKTTDAFGLCIEFERGFDRYVPPRSWPLQSRYKLQATNCTPHPPDPESAVS